MAAKRLARGGTGVRPQTRSNKRAWFLFATAGFSRKEVASLLGLSHPPAEIMVRRVGFARPRSEYTQLDGALYYAFCRRLGVAPSAAVGIPMLTDPPFFRRLLRVGVRSGRITLRAIDGLPSGKDVALPAQMVEDVMTWIDLKIGRRTVEDLAA